MGRTASKDWRKSRKNFFNNKVHFVFLTKRRGKVLTEEILSKLESIFKKICEKMKCELISFEGKADYVHLLVSIHPTLSISILTGKLKGTSSHLIIKEFSEQLKSSLIDNHFWSLSYAAFSHGEDPIKALETFLSNDKVSD